MLKNNPEISSQQGHLFNLYQIDDEITQYNSSEKLPLTVGINGVSNTTEKKIDKTVSFSLDKQKAPSAKTGWLKNLLIGGSVLMGIGTLAAGGAYMAGRAAASGRAERAVLPHPANSLTITGTFVPSSPAMQINEKQATEDAALIPEALRSPYSYYENIYGDAVMRNKIPQSAPITVARAPVEMTAGNSASAYMTEKTVSINPVLEMPENILTTHRPENGQSVYSDNTIKGNYYPLNSRFKKDLASFIISSVHNIVIKSYKADPKYKCELLSQIVDKISYYKDMDSILREINFGREDLTVEEQDAAILIRRKLTALYLAAETIINGNDTLHFYINAMKDYKNYTSEELIKREEYIMNYFSAHQSTGEC